MANIDTLLAANKIVLKSTKPGRHYTTCPQCSHQRAGAHKLIRVLGVTIHDKGAMWGCNHCGWTGPEKSNGFARHEGDLKTYDYVDENGEMLFQKVRGLNKKFWQRRPDGKGGWINKLGDTRKVIYRLPQVIKAIADGRTIVSVEGEKDVDNLWRIGIPATCNPDGAAKPGQKPKWRREYSEMLRGGGLVVMGDNDDAGRAHVEATAAMSVGIAPRVRVLDLAKHWPACPNGGDISDWLAAGHTREGLDSLIEKASDFQAGDFAERQPNSGGDDAAEIRRLAGLSQLEYERQREAAAKKLGITRMKTLVDDGAWPEPDMRLVNDDRPDAPDFDWDAIPPASKDLVRHIADDCGAPPDYVFAALIATTSAVLGNVRRVSPWAGWVEQPHLWFALVGPPSTNKTIALAPFKTACSVVEREAESGFKTALRDYEKRKEAAAAALAEWRNAVKEAVKDGKIPPPLPDDAREPEKPVPPRVMIADASTEQVGALLAGNHRGLVLVRSELSGWLGQFDRYGGAGADRAFYLEAWDGGSHTIDRVKFGGVPLRVPYASLSVLGSLQPDRLSDVFNGADDGLAARFLYMWPTPIAPRRPERSGDQWWAAMLREAFARLRKLDWARDDEGNPVPVVVRLEEKALEILDKLRIENFEDNQSDGSGIIAGWRGKNNGRLLRLALVFEMLQWALVGGPEPTLISVEMTARAADFLDYSTSMMERAIAGLALSDTERDAAKLSRLIKADHSLTIINERSIYRMKGFRSLREPDHRKRVLSILETAGWLRRTVATSSGRPPENWNINPKLEGTGNGPMGI